MGEGSGKSIVFKILLWSVFIVVTIYIVLWIYNIVNESGVVNTYEQGNDTRVFSCIEYSYDVSNYSYENGKLNLIVFNKKLSSYSIKSLTVRTDLGDEQVFTPKRFQPGTSKSFSLTGNMSSEFTVFVENCDIYAKKITMTPLST